MLHTHVTVSGAEPIRFPKQRSKSISLRESEPSPDGLDDPMSNCNTNDVRNMSDLSDDLKNDVK